MLIHIKSIYVDKEIFSCTIISVYNYAKTKNSRFYIFLKFQMCYHNDETDLLESYPQDM